MVLKGRAHATDVLTLFTSLSALVLGVTLYAITREEDADIAMLALTCRVVEAMPGEGAFFFAVGSTLFSWLLLRGRMIPVALAWLGVLASVLLVVLLPLQIADVLPGAVIQYMWLPMAAFEIPLGLWLIIKGAAVRAR